MDRNFLLFVLSSLLFLGGCKKEEDPVPPVTPPPVGQSMLRVSFLFMKGNGAYSLNDHIFDANGSMVKFDKVRFLISNIRALGTDGTVIHAFSGVVLKVDAAQPPATYHEIGLIDNGITIGDLAFDIGLDDATNALQPSDHSQPPLNDITTYVPGMGFKFLELLGRWDSNNSSTINSSDAPVSYICGTSSMSRQRSLYMNTTSQSLSIKVQMANLLNGVHCSSTSSTSGGGAVNTQIMNNLQAAITY